MVTDYRRHRRYAHEPFRLTGSWVMQFLKSRINLDGPIDVKNIAVYKKMSNVLIR